MAHFQNFQPNLSIAIASINFRNNIFIWNEIMQKSNLKIWKSNLNWQIFGNLTGGAKEKLDRSHNNVITSFSIQSKLNF